jgi:CBS domain-containing membrane protein
MTTDLLTVREHDAIDVVAFLMNQRGVRQILVEDDEERLVGVISYRSLLHMLATGRLSGVDRSMPVHEVMEREFLTVEPGTCTLEALRIMRDHNVTALPVVQRGRLVGIMSEHDFLPVLACMLEDQRAAAAAAPAEPAG